MKKILLVVFAVFSTSLSWAYDFSAVAPSGQTLYYNINGSNATVTYATNMYNPYGGVTVPMGNLTIPESVTYNGTTYLVTSIDSRAFYECYDLATVFIPSSVTSIGSSAFSGVRHIVYHGNATGANWGARWKNGYQEGDLVFSDTGKSILIGCRPSVTNVNIPLSVTRIDSRAFSRCIHLSSITIPNSVTNIGERAFDHCSALTSVDIPNSVTFIGSYAFNDCSSLTDIAISNSVTSIGLGMFHNCISIDSIIIPNSVTSIGMYAFEGCAGLTSITIPNSVRSIGTVAFQGCSGLASITIPNSVTSIEGGTFRDCDGLSRVILSDALTSIGNYAFDNCRNLTSIVIPNSVTSIGAYAFCQCTGLSSISFGNSLSFIDSYAFLGCSRLDSVVLPNSLTTIGTAAFMGCHALRNVFIPSSVTSIGSSAFTDCHSLSYVNVPGSVSSIAMDAFQGVNVVSYCGQATGSPWGAYNAGCFYVDDGFVYSSSAKDTLMGYLGTGTRITIPESVSVIASKAFKDRSDIDLIIVPDSVRSIGSEAFSGIQAVKYCGPFFDENWNVDNHIGCYTIDGDFVYGHDFYNNLVLVCYIGHDTDVVTIPDSVHTIGARIIRNGYHINQMNIPSSVVEVGVYMTRWWYQEEVRLWVTVQEDDIFALNGVHIANFCGDSLSTNPSYKPFGADQFGCFYPEGDFVYTSRIKDTLIDYRGNATEITIPSTVTAIGYGAFYNHHNITNVVIPNSVTSIGTKAFYECRGLKSVTIGKSVMSIGDSAFCGCDSLSTINYNATNCSTMGSMNHPAFQLNGKSIHLSIGENVQTIPAYAFRLCRGLTAVTIPDSVVSIGEYAFDYCETLARVVVGRMVTNIRDCAFRECRKLYHVTLGESVANIGQYAFNTGGTIDTVLARGLTPPTLTYQALSNYSICIVPCASESQYRQDGWHVVGTVGYDYQIISQDALKGRTVVVTPPACPSLSMTFSAVPYYGYRFSQWNDGDTTNPRVVTLFQDTTFTALFDNNQYTVAGVSADSVMGSVNGTATQNYLTTVTLSAVPNYGYRFAQWNDGNTDNPRIVQVDSNITYTAIFGFDQYTVAGVSADSVMGVVNGSATQDYLSTVTLTAVPNYGYHFAQWNDGSTVNPRTIEIDSNVCYTASFDYNQYTIAGVSADTVMGSVNGTATQNYLATVTLAAVSNYGYHFTQWNDGNTDNPRIVQVDSNITYTAIFGFDQYTVAGVSVDSVMGTVNGSATQDYLSTVTLAAVPNYGYHFTQWTDGDTTNPRIVTVLCDSLFTALFDPNIYTLTLNTNDAQQGTVSGSGTYEYGTTVSITATAAEHHHLVFWNDGNNDTVRQIVILSDTSFIATFAIDTVLVNIVANDISRGQVTGTGYYAYGEMVEATATAYSGYRFHKWDDQSTYNPYTFAALSDMTLTAIFVPEDWDGIADIDPTVLVKVIGNNIIVSGAEGQLVTIFDIAGRMVVREQVGEEKKFSMPNTGVFMVKIGDKPARKVVVVK